MFNIKPVTLFYRSSISKVGNRDCRTDPGKYGMVSFEQSIQKIQGKKYLLPDCHTTTIIKKNYREGNQEESQTSICPEHKRKKKIVRKILFPLIPFRLKFILPLPSRTCCCFFDLCIRNTKWEKLSKICLTEVNLLRLKIAGLNEDDEFLSTNAILWLKNTKRCLKLKYQKVMGHS